MASRAIRNFKHLILLSTLIPLAMGAVLPISAAAASTHVHIHVAAAYAKKDGSFYSVVVKNRPNTNLEMYVNDKNPTKAHTNKKDWATFRKVKLVGKSGKLSFTRIVKRSNGSTYQRPINYVSYYNVGSQHSVKFNRNLVKTNKAQPAKKITSALSTHAPAVTASPAPPTNCVNGTYVNSSGNTVCRPEASSSVPAGATAKCRDGTYSFSQHRSGTCSYHGGVAEWL